MSVLRLEVLIIEICMRLDINMKLSVIKYFNKNYELFV